jgi:MFS family permease
MRSVVRSSLPAEIKSSLDACWKEGVMAQIVLGIFDYYLIPYGIFLGATPQQIGFLIASPNFLSALAQLFAVRAVLKAGTRRGLLVGMTTVQALMLIPLAVLPAFAFPWKMGLLITLVSIFRVTGALMGPAWGSLVSDYLPEGQRGQYLGWRSHVVNLAGVANMAFWGLVLLLTKRVSQNVGFILLFSAAAAFRLWSILFMARMTEVHVAHAPETGLMLGEFFRKFRESNLVKFVCYVAGVTFATQLAAPFFSMYMLKDLKMGYGSYAVVHLSSVVAGLAAFPAWGRHADEVGNARIMKSVSLLLPLSPFLWAFARGTLPLVLVEIFSGFVWSGFTLASTNFLYDAVPPPLRVRWLAAFSLINGAAVFLGALLGGWMAPRLPPWRGSVFPALFLLSGFLRLSAHFILSHRFEEARATFRRVSSFNLFQSVLGLRPLAGEAVEPAVYPPLRPPRTPEVKRPAC